MQSVHETCSNFTQCQIFGHRVGEKKDQKHVLPDAGSLSKARSGNCISGKILDDLVSHFNIKICKQDQ